MKTITKISLGIAAIFVIFAFLVFLGHQEVKKTERTETINEFEFLINEEGQIRAAIIEIEQKHSSYGMVYFSEFSENELTIYFDLLNDLVNNNKNIYEWFIDNEEILNDRGITDLYISEAILELKQENEDITKKKENVAMMLKYKEWFVAS